MPGSNGGRSNNCTLTYMDGTASVSCVDSTSCGYQVILLQDNDPYNLTVINVRPGEKQTVPVVASDRYCIMELPMGDNFDSEIRYTREFIAEEEFTMSSTDDITEPQVIDRNIIISKTYNTGGTSEVLIKDPLRRGLPFLGRTVYIVPK